MPRFDQRGVAMSSPLALLAAGVVVVAGAAFVVTGGGRDKDVAVALGELARRGRLARGQGVRSVHGATPVQKAGGGW